MNNQLYRVIVGLQVMVIMSLIAFVTAGDQIILRLNAGSQTIEPQTIELSEASLEK